MHLLLQAKSGANTQCSRSSEAEPPDGTITLLRCVIYGALSISPRSFEVCARRENCVMRENDHVAQGRSIEDVRCTIVSRA